MSLLLLESSIRTRLNATSSETGWNQLAGSLAGLEPSAAPLSSSVLAGLDATMRAGLDLAKAFDTAKPGYTDALESLLDGQEAWTAAREDSLLRWSSLVEMSPIVRVLVLGVVHSNPALSSLPGVLDPVGWSPTGPLGAALPVMQQAGGKLDSPLPGLSSLPEELHRPSDEHPDSLKEQLLWILDHWSEHLSAQTHKLALLALDLLSEEEQVRGNGPGPVQLPGLGSFDEFAASHSEHRDGAFALNPNLAGYIDSSPRFSEDAAWMPRLVLIAKQTYVWLAQLSRQYERSIVRLDEIPEEELERLAQLGFTGLWLIGLWERSPASRTIKVRCGNPEAESSAYSLRSYDVAERLGGPEALDRLRERARHHGLRLAADMVPNHMGMDSQWMVDHPDWFVQLQSPPFPNYRFDGPDISGDPRIALHLEDGYWSQSDAAVVFKHVDKRTNQVRFVYHGNDGTQMPWNDTAQLDYLQPQVREAVIQTILGVARQFPVIRFDAAMTLARKHIARLWYPPPGEGGAIPSRAANSVPQEVFDRLVGGEFWREVVERIQAEVPDTLLLAEAFWMMEGYFVRTLGMHRVYNSAFMHMLRDEDNAGYRGAIKSVLEYSPAILERYVNFMNNPDEETAVEQFGKGDKYFGITTLMATLPGLPMFGHGQFEGYSEKYGMEYTRPKRDELPDHGLVDHHKSVIVPLLRERKRFSGVTNFCFLDFWRGDEVDENVFAYTNRCDEGSGSSLVLYNNSYQSTQGWISQSTAINIGETDTPHLIHRSLADALGLDPQAIYGLWELHHQAWIVRSGAELSERGLELSLSGYEALVFLDIQALDNEGGVARRLLEELGGDWCFDLDGAIANIQSHHEEVQEDLQAREQHSAESTDHVTLEPEDESLQTSQQEREDDKA